MSLSLKRKLPSLYKFLKKFEKFIPYKFKLWDQKNYDLNLKIVSTLRLWKSWPRLKLEAQEVFNAYNGGDFIDVGAHEGIYSFILAPKSEEKNVFVLCEPDIKIKKDLLENVNTIKKNFKNLKIETIFQPIGNGLDVIEHKTIYGHSTFVNKSFNNNENKFKSKDLHKSIKVDSLVDQLKLNPKFLKIDVEGSEHEVLEGAAETLKKFRPLIMIEKHPKMIPARISIEVIDDFLKRVGYKMENLIFKDDLAITEIWKPSS